LDGFGEVASTGRSFTDSSLVALGKRLLFGSCRFFVLGHDAYFLEIESPLSTVPNSPSCGFEPLEC